MEKFLVIVESPAKAKTINKYLGNDYIVKSSFGHVRDLPSSNLSIRSINDDFFEKGVTKLDKKHLLIRRMGINPYNGWIAQYVILPGKEKFINEISLLAKHSKHIYLATDLDREGEAIAWHLQELIKVDRKKISRVIFNEITYDSITQAFKHPTVLNISKVQAQQARRFMDRLVGYMLSPLLWKKIARGLSAGRVQSVAVRLIVERERRIKSFVSKEYWKLYVDLAGPTGNILSFQVVRDGKSRFIPTTEEELNNAQDILSRSTSHYVIDDKIDKYLDVQSSPPFITSTLQQSANLHFGYSIRKTMLLAQRLYESGYITYIRTDSVNISQAALTVARSYIRDVFGEEYVLKKHNNECISVSCMQNAHEAIRPSDIYCSAELIGDQDSDLKKLYHLIWCRFIASQMQSSRCVITTLLIRIRNFKLQISNRSCCFDGWKKIMSTVTTDSENKQNIFSDFEKGKLLVFKRIVSTRHFTKAPIRYNEASLVKELERRGIGRPSTYVSIISTIQDRGYVYLYNKNFYASKIGEIVTDRLFESFYELMDYQFTANMEDILDKIADNKEEWKSVLDSFFVRLSEKLGIAEKCFEDGGMRSKSIVLTSIICPLCRKKMGIRIAVTGVFLSCEGYEKVLSLKNRCKYTINLIPEILEYSAIKNNVRQCKKCNSVMDSYFIDSRQKLHICINNPLCTGYILETGKFSIQKGYETVQCDKCMHDMCLKFGRFGRYMSCSNLDCKNTMKILSNGYVISKASLLIPFPELLCEKSEAYFVLRNGKSGVFLAANTFPKSRETRAPLVEELVRFRDRLPKELVYLADAPIRDDCGNKTLVRFNKKNKQQYVVSVKNGKCTNWRSVFINGFWQVNKKQ